MHRNSKHRPPQTTAQFWRSLGRRGPLRLRHRPNTTIREMASWYPKSVWQSLVDRTNWLAGLNVSPVAKKLTRLQGRQFVLAVQRIIHNAN